MQISGVLAKQAGLLILIAAAPVIATSMWQRGKLYSEYLATSYLPFPAFLSSPVPARICSPCIKSSVRRHARVKAVVVTDVNTRLIAVLVFYRRLIFLHRIQIFINNEFVDSVSGKTFPTFNPSTGAKIADVQEGDKEDVDKAVKAARAAFIRGSEWRTMDASKRGKLILKLADLMEENLDYMASLETLDNGKPFKSAVGDVMAAVATIRYFAGFADKVHGKTIPMDGNTFAYTRREPIGVIGQIIPWNVPLLMLSWKLGPALAMGNTVVVKPAEQTPLTALLVASYVAKAGFPPGVVNVVPGFGETAGAAISNHPDVDKVAFTGSTEVSDVSGMFTLSCCPDIAQRKAYTYAWLLATLTSRKFHSSWVERAPLIIFPDADLGLAANLAHEAVFWNQGEICCAATRTYVHADVYDKFVAKAVELAKKKVVGDPFDEREEIFGPVQSIFKFQDINEVIERANATNYGLAAGIITKDLNTATIVAHALEAGTVWINTYFEIGPHTPFGGYKMSGIGREMGEDGIMEYTEIKTVVTRIPVKY
ncbi:hypothetical protein MRX96_033576 [Rhipicephalus microplus]